MIKIEIPDTIKKTLINLRYEIVSFLMFTLLPFIFFNPCVKIPTVVISLTRFSKK